MKHRKTFQKKKITKIILTLQSRKFQVRKKYVHMERNSDIGFSDCTKGQQYYDS